MCKLVNGYIYATSTRHAAHDTFYVLACVKGKCVCGFLVHDMLTYSIAVILFGKKK